jgi:hypothetical protein
MPTAEAAGAANAMALKMLAVAACLDAYAAGAFLVLSPFALHGIQPLLLHVKAETV